MVDLSRIHRNDLFLPILLVVFLFFWRLFPFSRRQSAKQLFIQSLIFTLMVLTLSVNIYGLAAGKRNALYFVFKHPFLSYDEKMRESIGRFVYDYIIFIKKNTPEDAIILIPPQGYPWPQTGNMAYIQYFLYPRYLVNGKEKEAGVDFKEKKIDYVLLAWGESTESQYGFTNGWPKFDLKAKQIIYMDKQLGKKIVTGDYHYDPEGKDLWGIIVLKR